MVSLDKFIKGRW